MKILYLGHYRDGSGWSRCSIDHMRALQSVDLNIVARPVLLNKNIEPPEDIKLLEEKSSIGWDVCIQHLLPHHMEKWGKCIGSFVSESSSIKYSSWPAHLKQMDDVWVANHDMIAVCNEIGITPRVIHHSIDLSRYKNTKKTQLPPGFNFYTIIDFNKRKNLIALLKAFHLEFRAVEPVNLVIKTSKFNTSKEQLLNEVREMCSKVKQSLKIYSDISRFKPEIIIVDRLTDEQICQLHNSCDCYICTSYEEGWGYPIQDAQGFGNIVISNKVGGPKEYITDKEDGYLIDNTETPCFGAEGFADIYTGYETWKDINIIQLRKIMRETYENPHDNMRSMAKEKVKEFSYEKIGTQMLNAINNIK